MDCDGDIDGDDALALLLHGAESAAPAGGACPPVGAPDGDGVRGDVDCDGTVDARDALLVLLAGAGLPLPPLPEGCPGP